MERIPGSYSVPVRTTIGEQPMIGRAQSFLNFTDLQLEDAKKVHNEVRTIAELGEQYRINRLDRGQRAEDLRNGKIWNEEDEDFFEDLDLSSYEINIQRPLFNTITEAQQEQNIRFRVAPKDIHAHHRYVSGKENFVTEFEKDFGSPEAAGEYFDENVDDEFGIMLSALMMDSRENSDGADAESEAFDDGAFGGMSVLKATYSTKYDRNIGVSIDSLPQNAIIYDEARSKNYECDDISFVGEIHDYYPEDLIEEYPQFKDQIENTYRHLILNRRTFQSDNSLTKWKDWYEFVGFGTAGDSKNLRLKVADLWTRHSESKIRAVDKQTNKIHVAKFDVEFDQIIDRLMEFMVQELYQETVNNPEFVPQDLEKFQDPTLKDQLANKIAERYEFEEIYESRWYKTVFTFNGIFEHTPSPYPHNEHPYSFYFSQYHHGYFRGLGEDVVDVVVAFNKAIAFRELIMAHGAKNVLLVDESMLADNDIDKNDIADQWTRIGSVIALKLRPGFKMGDVALPVNTVGDNLDKINTVIDHYAALLNSILGIIPEQLGQSAADAPASRFNMQIKQGLGNNGLIFKNFFRTLKILYRKVLMMEVDLLKVRKERVVKLLGDEYRYYFDSNFLSVEWNDDFALFEETLRTGQFGLKIIPINDDPQMGAAREGIMFEMAGQGAIPVELAFKYSSWEKRHQFVRDLKKSRKEEFLQQQENRVDINLLNEKMISEGVNAEVANKIINSIRLENAKKINQSQNGQVNRGNKGKGNNGRIRELATQMGQTQRQDQAQVMGVDNRQSQPQ